MSDERSAAFGGAGWRPRATSLAEELGSVWAPFAVDSEWAPLTDVLVHAPGPEVAEGEPDARLMTGTPDWERAFRQHERLAATYRSCGVRVHPVLPETPPAPNQMFVADLFLMTPAGAIVGRPASPVRAGEERWVARRLADLGVPILRTVGGLGTFEGADAIWLDRGHMALGRTLRSNDRGIEQVRVTLAELGVEATPVDVDPLAMHLMGAVRIVDRDLAFVRQGLVSDGIAPVLASRGYDVCPFPDERENREGMAHNFVTVGPRKIVMPSGNPRSEGTFRGLGIEVLTVDVREIREAAGAIGCLTGILARRPVTRDPDGAV